MSLIPAALLTICVETLFWFCFRKYRNWRFLLWCAAVNLWSNLTLNCVLLLMYRPGDTLFSQKVLLGECIVVLAEFLLLASISKSNLKKLFILTFSANVLTYSLSFVC